MSGSERPSPFQYRAARGRPYGAIRGFDGAAVFHFWKDARRVYCNPHVFAQADPASFRVFPNSAYAREKQHIYYMADRLDAADPDRFEVIDGFSARDCHRRYHYGLAEDSGNR